MSEHEDEKLWEHLAHVNDEELAENERKAAELLSSLGWVRPVLCIECVQYHEAEGYCNYLTDNDTPVFMDPDDYCSYGARERDD